MRIADNIEMLEISNGGTNLYPVLAWDEKNIALIDTGLPGQMDLILTAVQNAGINPENITTVILTHHDMDHIGNAKLFREREAKIMAHELETPYIQGDACSPKLVKMEKRLQDMNEGELAFYKRVKANAPLFYVAVDQKLTDGEVLPICDGIKVIHTPGHTPGHMALLFQSEGILVAGDAANIANGVLAGANPQHTLDMEIANRSFERIKALGTKKVVCYHGGCVDM